MLIRVCVSEKFKLAHFQDTIGSAGQCSFSLGERRSKEDTVLPF